MIEIYIGSDRLDTYKDEDVNIKLSLQNVKDISKLFTDYTQNFQVPASTKNNKVFKHYYNADIDGGFAASQRQDAVLYVNKEVFREGSIELLSVDMKNGKPSAYDVVFFSAGVNLKDLFGEDTLNDLDLSALDHTYNDTNLQAGLSGYVSGTDSSVIYPLISPVRNWEYWDELKIDYFEFKPAIKLTKIIDAIESKYSITFNSDFFATSDFGKLFMWCHRRAGYMFKDQENGFTATTINFVSSTGTGFDTSNDYYVVQSGVTEFIWRYSINSSSDYQVHFYKNGEYLSSRSHSGNITNENLFITQIETGDKIQMRFSPPTDWDGSSISISNIQASGRQFDNPLIELWSASRTASQSFSQDLVMADQMPEQKVSDFISSLVKMFNLVIDPITKNEFDIEPLDDWYGEGTNKEITQYIDIQATNIIKPELYRRINFQFNETGSILGEDFRLKNDRGYGDLRADFTFDGDELDVQVGFDKMKFEKLQKPNDYHTQINVGKSITRDLETYIGDPFIFYVPDSITISDGNNYEYGDMTSNHQVKTRFWLCSNVNATGAGNVTKTINFGNEFDPYLLQAFSQSLYENYWKDYITDLYSGQRRIYKMKAKLPAKVSTQLKMNDKLDINGRRYVINEIQINLRTNEATLELLNDV